MRKIILSISTTFLIILLLTITQKNISINSNNKNSILNEGTNPTQNVINTNIKNTVQNIDNSPTEIHEPGIDQDGVVTFDDEYFGYLHHQVEENPTKYNGKKVIITGFVYKNSDFDENEFKVARMASSFCSDPPSVFGLMSSIENAADFEHGQWITAKGTLVVTSYTDPKTNFEYNKVYLEPENIEKIDMRDDYFLY